jgi:hypothetical protein
MIFFISISPEIRNGTLLYVIVRIILKGPWQSTGIQLVAIIKQKYSQQLTIFFSEKCHFTLHIKICRIKLKQPLFSLNIDGNKIWPELE